MTIDTLKRIGTFILICLAQVLIFNNIHLFRVATPLIYIYFVIMFPRNMSKWSILLWSFFMGLVIDMFTNMPGVASASMTLIAAIQPYWLELFIPRDADEALIPSVKTLRWGTFLTYSSLLVIIFCLTYFSLEAFNFYNFFYWLQCVLGTTLLTIILIASFETIKK